MAFRPVPKWQSEGMAKFFPIIPALLVVALSGCPAPRKTSELPKVITLDGAAVAEVRVRARAGDDALQPALDALRKRSEQALMEPLVEIAGKPKEFWALSGDPKDYISVSKFAWPDPANPGKWVMIDGTPNTAAMANFDGPKIAAMANRVIALAQGYYFLGEKTYARAAAEQLRAWFLDPATAMNPNMNFAQAIKPDENGQPWGIIDANRFPEILNSVGLIADSGEWTPSDEAALKKWFTAFNRWLIGSPLGKKERAAKNNHGTFYDLILASGAAYVGDEATVREVLEAVGPVRLDGQIAADGSTPEEMRRAESAMYTLWNLSGLTDLAALGVKYGIDIWNHPGAQNPKLKQTGDFLLPYATGELQWTFGKQQMNPKGPMGFFRRIAPVYDDPQFNEAVASMAATVNPDELAAEGSNLLHPWPAGKEPWRK